MTTFSGSATLSMASDANFRTLIIEFTTRMAAVGLVQTADTGQVNTATVVRAASFTDAGYQIWRFADALQATAPIFLKIFYGTPGANTRWPRMRVQVGTGTDGAGTLTNPSAIGEFSSLSTTALNHVLTSYFCQTSGFFGMVLGRTWGQARMAGAALAVARTVDSTGAPDGRGVLCLLAAPSTGSSIVSCGVITMSFSSPVVSTSSVASSSALLGTVIGVAHSAADTSIANGATGGDLFAYPAITLLRGRYEQFPGVAWGFQGEVGAYGTYVHALIGSVSRSYLNVEHAFGNVIVGQTDAAPNDSKADAHMTWE